MVISLREVEESVCSCISNSAIRLPFMTSQLAADAFGGKPKCANLFSTPLSTTAIYCAKNQRGLGLSRSQLRQWGLDY